MRLTVIRTLAGVLALLAAQGAARADKSGVRPNVISVPGGPGTLKGLGEQFEPSLNTGSATYEVPLELPAGNGGFTPNLALRYDSGQGMGTTGLGWSLDVGSIQRDTAHGVPRYLPGDRFVWAGQELVPMGKDVYRPKIEGSFLRFQRSGDRWEATSRDGTTYWFGNTAAARSGGQSGIFRWALEGMADASGNRIVFEYERDGGQLYPTRIAYGRAGVTSFVVTIAYEARPDAFTDYRPGFPVMTKRRATRITTSVRGAQVRRYELRYEEPSATSALSRLASVTAYGTDDKTHLPPVAFAYSGFDPASHQVRSLANAPAFTLVDPNTELADFDGDGLPDLVHTALGRHQVALNGGDEAGWRPAIAIPSNPSVQLAAKGTELADMNGDGIVDLIAKLAPGAGDFVYFPNRGAGDWGAATRFRNNPAFSFEDPGVRLVDVNGDGLVDVMQTTPTGYYQFLNAGDGSWGPGYARQTVGRPALSFTDPRVHLADMNGDRLMDLVEIRDGAVDYYPASGWGMSYERVSLTGAPSLGAEQARVQLGDMNGDGLADLWLASGTELRMWLQRGDATFAAPLTFTGLPEANPLTTMVRVADMNGSGTSDVVWHSAKATGADVWRYLDLTGGVRPNLLTTIENGMGRTIRLDYTSSGAMFQMAAAAGRPWKTRLPIPTQLVGSITTSDGRGWSKQEAFVYRDGYYDAATRQFRGFASTTEIEPGNDEEATSVQVHTFDVGATHEALKGVELGLELRDATGAVLRRETSAFDVKVYGQSTDGYPVAGPERSSRIVEHVEGSAKPVTTFEEWTYDDYGNVLVHSEWGVVEGDDLLAAHDERITTTTYAQDPTAWILGRPCRVLVTDAAGTRLAETRTYYDGAPFVGLPLGMLGREALPMRTEAWVEGDRFVNTSRVEYDDHRLPSVTLDARGHRREVGYDQETHRFPVAERVFVSAGKALTFEAGYDAATGTMAWFTDPAGRKTTFHHSPLLQLVSIVKPGDTDAKPTTTFEYVYGAPLSTIVSRSRVRPGGDEVLEKHHYYDGLGRDVGLVEQAEDGKTLTSGLKVFGPNGRVVRELEPAFTDGFALGAPRPKLAFTAHRYDALGRVTRSVLPDGSFAEKRFSPLTVEHWDAEDLDPRSPHAGTPRIERANALGVTQVDERLGGATISTKFLRDGLGRLQRIVDAASNTTTYTFDGLGRVRELSHPDAGKTTTVFDDVGNALSRTDARGATVTATYDGANRLLTETLTAASGKLEERVAYHYDGPSPHFPRDQLTAGELTWVEDASGVEHYSHDLRDHLAEVYRVVDGREYHLALQHDGLDRLTRVTYPDGRALDYEYGARGLLRAVPGILNDVTYDEHGLATQREYANGAVTTARYDEMERLGALGTTLGGAQVQSLAIGYDRVGNVASIADAVHATGALSATRSFVYDDLYRLRTAATPEATPAWSYDFDDLGNWQRKSGVGNYAYDSSRPHLPSKAGLEGYAFDEAGQLTTRPGAKQTFDAKGRLASVTMADGTAVTYRRDYTGAVVVKETNGPRGAHRTVYVDKLAEERDGASIDYVFAGGLRIARIGGDVPVGEAIAGSLARVPAAAGTTGVFALAFAGMFGLFRPGARRRMSRLVAVGLALLVFDLGASGCGSTGTSAAQGIAGAIYYHQDHLQGVAFETDDRGEIVAESAFDPYGGDLHATTEPYAFTGKERDADTGLYDFGARAYDPKLGLFLSPDPAVLDSPELTVEDPQLLNVYAYARNNPTTHVDPDGRFPHILVGALVGAAIGGGAYLIKAAVTKDFSIRGAIAATGGGAVSGAVAAATGGASLIAQGAVSGVAGGLASRAIETASISQTLSPRAIATDAALGVVGAAAGKVAVKVASKVAPKVAAAVKAAVVRGKAALKGSGPKGLDLRFSQTTASPRFHEDGYFNGKTIGSLASELRSGALSPDDVPVKYAVIGGNNLIVNTRSSLALTRAGIPRSDWRLINSTADDAADIQARLLRNKLTSEGTRTLRITGCGQEASSLE